MRSNGCRVATALLACVALLATVTLLLVPQRPAQAYIVNPPLTLGMMCHLSAHIMIGRIEKLDRDKGVVIIRKVRDVRGKWPTEVMRHYFPPAFPNRGYVLKWAQEGKTVICFCPATWHWSHTYIDGEWYLAGTSDGETWNVAHSEPLLLRMYSARTDRLGGAVTDICAGREVVVSGMVDGNVEDLKHRRAKVQRLKASLKLLDYNPKRDFLGWGSDEIRVPVKLEDVPKPAVKAVQERFAEATIRYVDRQAKDIYEFAMKEGDRRFGVGVKADGKLLNIKEEIANDKLPKAVTEGLLKKHPGAKVVETEKVIVIDGKNEKVTYELKVKADKKTFEVVLDEGGKDIGDPK